MNRVALTFDNGPDERATALVLDALGRADVRATFFVVGSRITAAGMRLLRRAVDEGHLIGNHTWSHSGPLGEMTSREAVAEIARTGDLIAGLAASPPLFRPVGGGEGGVIDRRLLNTGCVEHLRVQGYTTVLWNVVPRDWIDPDGWVETAMTLSGDIDHACVVLHDIHAAARLDDYLARLRERGTDFTQEFPAECTPILAGRSGDIRGIVSD
jgi:peptidoglycan-N-acetylglucosamine deacetylase